MNPIHQITGLILSAGKSSRMGSPKALLEFKDGATLLSKQVDLLRSANCTDITVVVGADTEAIRQAHTDIEVNWVINDKWELGQFSSLQAGLKSIGSMDVILLPIDVIGH